jgi:hypothetical protein
MKHRPPDIFESVPVNLYCSRDPLDQDPENCGYAAGCDHHPKCVNEGHCLGFKNESLSPVLTRIGSNMVTLPTSNYKIIS